MHAREIINPELVLNFVESLVSNPEYRDIVANNQIYFIPVVNGDGYKRVFEKNRFERKNSNRVDLNRNFSPGFSSTCGGSVNTTNMEYRGPYEASEIETQTILKLSQAKKFAKVLDLHSRGRVIFCGYSRCLKRPDSIHQFIKEEGARLAKLSQYDPPRDAVTAGKQEQWQYIYSTWYAFLIETYEGKDWQPSFDVALSEIERVKPMMYEFLKRLIPLEGRVIDAKTKNPLQTRIEYLNLSLENGESRSSDGKFGSFYEFLPAGVYRVRFTSEGYREHVETIKIVPDSQTRISISLNRDSN